MTFDLAKILESKRAYHRNLANRPVAEKLAMLDALCDRTLTIRQAAAIKAYQEKQVRRAIEEVQE